MVSLLKTYCVILGGIMIILFLATLQLGMWLGLAWLAWFTFPYGLIAFLVLVWYTSYKETKEIENDKKN